MCPIILNIEVKIYVFFLTITVKLLIVMMEKVTSL